MSKKSKLPKGVTVVLRGTKHKGECPEEAYRLYQDSLLKPEPKKTEPKKDEPK